MLYKHMTANDCRISDWCSDVFISNHPASTTVALFPTAVVAPLFLKVSPRASAPNTLPPPECNTTIGRGQGRFVLLRKSWKRAGVSCSISPVATIHWQLGRFSAQLVSSNVIGECVAA